jgi:hypothetical protein
MASAAGPRHTPRSARKVDYRISSSSSSSSSGDIPIQLLYPTPSQFVKLETPGKNRLAQLSPESFQNKDLSDSDDTPLVPHLLRASPTGKEERFTYTTFRRESVQSHCVLTTRCFLTSKKLSANIKNFRTVAQGRRFRTSPYSHTCGKSA